MSLALSTGQVQIGAVKGVDPVLPHHNWITLHRLDRRAGNQLNGVANRRLARLLALSKGGVVAFADYPEYPGRKRGLVPPKSNRPAQWPFCRAPGLLHRRDGIRHHIWRPMKLTA